MSLRAVLCSTAARRRLESICEAIERRTQCMLHVALSSTEPHITKYHVMNLSPQLISVRRVLPVPGDLTTARHAPNSNRVLLIAIAQNWR